jgi:type II secretory pathway pseudopilin PulG
MELVVVLVIIGLLSAVAIPRFTSSIAYHRTRAAAARVAADLELAASYAVHTSSVQTVAFTGNQYTISTMPHPDRPGVPYRVDLSAEPYQASIVAADFGGDPEVTFDIFGKPDTDGSVVLRSGHHQCVVTLDPETGKTTVDAS